MVHHLLLVANGGTGVQGGRGVGGAVVGGEGGVGTSGCGGGGRHRHVPARVTLLTWGIRSDVMITSLRELGAM